MTDHESQLKDHLRRATDAGRPMFVTTDGEAVAVMLSPAAYDRLASEAELVRSFAMLESSMEDINAGRTQPAKKAIDEIATECGLKLKRKPARG